MRYRPVKTMVDCSSWVEFLDALIDLPLSKYCVSEEEIKKVWGYDTSSAFITNYFIDHLNTRLKWASTRSVSQVFLEELYEAFNPPIPMTEFIGEFYESIDPALCMIHEYIDEMVGDLPWWVWIPFRRGDYIVVNPIDDYRVMQFDNKVEEGLITPDQERKVCTDDFSWIAMT